MWAYLRNVGRKNGKENSRPIRCNRWKTQKGRPLREWLDDVVEYVEYMCTWGNGNLATVRGKARNHENCAEPASATGGRHLYGQCALGA